MPPPQRESTYRRSPIAALNRPLTRVCHPSPADRNLATTSLSSRRVTWVLLWPFGRPRRATASTILGIASRAGRAVRSSAAVSGASSDRDALLLARLSRFISPHFRAVSAAKTDQSHALRPLGEDHSMQAVGQPTDRCSPLLAVGSPERSTTTEVTQSKFQARSKPTPCFARSRAALAGPYKNTE